MMNVVFILLANEAFSDVIESMNSKKFLLAPLACSRPPSFHKYNVIDLWLITFTMSRAIRETTQLRYCTSAAFQLPIPSGDF